MNGSVKHKNLVSCLLKRQQGTFSFGEEDVLSRFVERQAAYQSKQYMKCELPGSPRSTFMVAFSPDGTKLASTHGDHTVRITELKTGRCLDTLSGHPRTPWSVAFHPSRHNILASGCLGGEVRVWDLNRGTSVVYRQSTAIASLTFHPTDMVLLIATDNQLHFWNWDQPTPFACIDTPCKRQKLRLVKFDPLGQRILTGIRNLPDVFQSQVVRPERTTSAGHAILFNTVFPRQATSNLNTATSSNANETTHRRLATHLIRSPARNNGPTALHHFRTSVAIIEPSSRLLSGVSSSQVTEVVNMTLTASLQARIDQAIADTLAEQGHVAMAANMTTTTCRLQLWDFTKLEMPKLHKPECNIIVAWCKLYNDASTDISQDGRLLGAFVPNVNNTAECGNICVFSLESYNLGQCLFSKKFGPNAISVSFSPLSDYVMVGLSSRRIQLRTHGTMSTYQPVAQIYKFNNNAETMEHVSSLKCPIIPNSQLVSTNAAFWNPLVGSGLVYGTNKGDLYLCYPPLRSETIF